MLGEMSVWYLFLGGSGAGLLLVTGVTMLFVPSWDAWSRMASQAISMALAAYAGVWRVCSSLPVPPLPCSLSWASHALPSI